MSIQSTLLYTYKQKVYLTVLLTIRTAKMKKFLFFLNFIFWGFGLLNAKTGPAEMNVFYPYLDEESGLYGIKYNDEIVMLPYFEKLEGGGKEPIFYYYNEDGKTGIFTFQGFVTAPIFDEILPLSPYFKYSLYSESCPRFGRIGNIWKIITADNLFDLPFECDDICGIWSPSYTNFKVLVLRPKNGNWSLFTKSGIDLLQGSKIKDFKPEDLLSGIKREKLEKVISKSYKKLLKKAEKDKDLSAKLNLYNEVQYTLIREKKPFSPEESLKLSQDITSYPIEIGGFKGVINEMGIIDIPVKYNSYTDILKRNPNNLYALEVKMTMIDIPYAPTHSVFESSEEFDEVERIQFKLSVERAKAYDFLVKEAIRQGWDIDSPLVKHFMKNGDVDASVKNYNDLVAKQEERYEFNRKLDAFASALSNSLMQASEVIGGGSISPNTASSTSITNKEDYAAPKSVDNKNKADGKEKTASEQIRCNSDKRVYGKYESMIIKAKTYGSASGSEIEEWQNKMRSLRKKWEDKGYSFPRSPHEK